MKLLIAAVLGIVILAGIYREDIAGVWKRNGTHVTSPSGGSAGRLGNASRRNFGSIGRSVGGR